MNISLCEHDLPIRTCGICREVAALESARAAWGASAAAVRDAGKKLEALEKENAALRQALRAIAHPIAAMQKAVPKGHLFNGAMAVQIAADPAYYQGIAQEALDEIKG